MKNMTHALRIGLASTGAALALLAISSLAAQAAITSSLDLGSKGSQVTELQTYLASNATIYPSGLITGYFGALTQAGVQNFQIAQGIVTNGTPATTGFGRVGPTTMARINSLENGGTQMSVGTSPSLSNPIVQTTNTTVTITWTTDRLTQGQVYWDAAPLVSNEATGPRQQPYVSGTLALDAGGLQVSHSVTISNLQANTTYYYLVRAVDSAGNMSMVWPSSFHTNQ